MIIKTVKGGWYMHGRPLTKAQIKAAGFDPDGEFNKGRTFIEIPAHEIARVVSEEIANALNQLIEQRINPDVDQSD